MSGLKPLKPKDLKKSDDNLETVEDDKSHRRFSCTLQSTQVITAFKKCVHKNEVPRDKLITCYRVVLKKLLQDPDLTDEEFISMYGQIQSKANEVYERRSRNLRKIRG